MKLRALVADDHSIVIAGLKLILQEAGVELVGTTDNGKDLVTLAENLRPDVIILDISMPILNGIEAARRIRAECPKIKLIFLSMHLDAEYIREAFLSGASAYLLKGTAAFELETAIREVMEGRKYVSPRVAQSLGSFVVDPSLESFGKDLSHRQREVLQLVAEGKTAKEISTILNISVKTVEYHKANIMSTLGLRSSADVVAYAIRHKVIAG
jgi:DNA-binding NarL/FixJ family response regulator